MIRTKRVATAFACLVLSSTQLISAQADESLRVKRPSATTKTASLPARTTPIGRSSSTQSSNNQSSDAQSGHGQPDSSQSVRNVNSPPDDLNSKVLSGSAQTNDVLAQPQMPMSPPEFGAQIQQRSILTIENWQRAKIDAANALMAQQANSDGSPNAVHHGMLHHLAAAAGTVGAVGLSTAGTVAVTYAGGSRHSSLGRVSSPPTITIEPGHCPAATDPAFQVPYSWWQDLSSEQSSDPIYAEPWNVWLGAVRQVFQPYAGEIRSRGVASIHVIINPDGSIYNMTPFFGEGRSGECNLQTQDIMRKIILSVGNFPPFPVGTHVRCYHLIFDARYN